MQLIRTWVLTFNLFKQAYNDAHGRRNEILSTRLYIILMLFGFIVIGFYSSLTEHQLTYHVESHYCFEIACFSSSDLGQVTISE